MRDVTKILSIYNVAMLKRQGLLRTYQCCITRVATYLSMLYNKGCYVPIHYIEQGLLRTYQCCTIRVATYISICTRRVATYLSILYNKGCYMYLYILYNKGRYVPITFEHTALSVHEHGTSNHSASESLTAIQNSFPSRLSRCPDFHLA